eukprot:TRINITY_DN1854_c2_g1_i1.p1 TRINITY_DN1854_c2_g1~~TRINITY_DN1854_c2_g1_i1.p1  ORF type:complete len:551 (+),score=80.89 TRINITY_DN1854_c2_g1_i1:47-1699(+)
MNYFAVLLDDQPTIQDSTIDMQHQQHQQRLNRRRKNKKIKKCELELLPEGPFVDLLTELWEIILNKLPENDLFTRVSMVHRINKSFRKNLNSVPINTIATITSKMNRETHLKMNKAVIRNDNVQIGTLRIIVNMSPVYSRTIKGAINRELQKLRQYFTGITVLEYEFLEYEFLNSCGCVEIFTTVARCLPMVRILKCNQKLDINLVARWFPNITEIHAIELMNELEYRYDVLDLSKLSVNIYNDGLLEKINLLKLSCISIGSVEEGSSLIPLFNRATSLQKFELKSSYTGFVQDMKKLETLENLINLSMIGFYEELDFGVFPNLYKLAISISPDVIIDYRSIAALKNLYYLKLHICVMGRLENINIIDQMKTIKDLYIVFSDYTINYGTLPNIGDASNLGMYTFVETEKIYDQIAKLTHLKNLYIEYTDKIPQRDVLNMKKYLNYLQKCEYHIKINQDFEHFLIGLPHYNRRWRNFSNRISEHLSRKQIVDQSIRTEDQKKHYRTDPDFNTPESTGMDFYDVYETGKSRYRPDSKTRRKLPKNTKVKRLF